MRWFRRAFPHFRSRYRRAPDTSGMGGRRGATPARPPEVKYEPTAWGRYAKILLSASEFFFIN